MTDAAEELALRLKAHMRDHGEVVLTLRGIDDTVEMVVVAGASKVSVKGPEKVAAVLVSLTMGGAGPPLSAEDRRGYERVRRALGPKEAKR